MVSISGWALRHSGVNDSAGDAVVGQNDGSIMLHVIAFGLGLLGLAIGPLSEVPKHPVVDVSEKTLPQFSQPEHAIRNPRVQAEDCDSAYALKRVAIEGGTAMGEARHGSFLLFRQVDLKAVEKLTYRLSADGPVGLELRLDSPTGPVVSTLNADKTGEFAELSTPVRLSPGVYDLYFVVYALAAPYPDLLRLDWIHFHRKTSVLPRLGG